MASYWTRMCRWTYINLYGSKGNNTVISILCVMLGFRFLCGNLKTKRIY